MTKEISKYNYVIIGNSAGAIGAVEAIRLTDKENKILIISDETYKVYGRPLISYYLENKVDDNTIYFRADDYYEKMNIDVLYSTMATKIDAEKKTILVEKSEEINPTTHFQCVPQIPKPKTKEKNSKFEVNEISYEKLLLATGSKVFIPPNIEGINLKNVFTFLTYDDAKEIKKVLNNKSKVVVLGAGLTGLKAAESIAATGVDTTVVELMDRVLPLALDKTGSKILKEILEEKITFKLNDSVTEVIAKKGEKKFSAVQLKSGKKLPCDIFIVAVGVRPRTELAIDCGLKVNRGIVVNNLMQTSNADIYATGDCCESYDFLEDGFKILPLWPTAYAGGRIAGINIAGGSKKYNWGCAMNATSFFGVPVLSAGLLDIPKDKSQNEYEVLTKEISEKKIYKKIILKDNIIQGFLFIGEAVRTGILLGLMRENKNVLKIKNNLLSSAPDFIEFEKEWRDKKILSVGKENL